MKSMTFFKIFVGVVFALALFASNLDQRILLAVILIGLLGTLLLTVLPRIPFTRWKEFFLNDPKKRHLPVRNDFAQFMVYVCTFHFIHLFSCRFFHMRSAR